jgi:hypothetical protein
MARAVAILKYIVDPPLWHHPLDADGTGFVAGFVAGQALTARTLC